MPADSQQPSQRPSSYGGTGTGTDPSSVDFQMKHEPQINILLRIQAMIQYWLVPAIWLPLIRWPHFTEKRWVFNVGPEEAMTLIRDALEHFSGHKEHGEFRDQVIAKSSPTAQNVMIFTPCARWLDMFEVRCKAGETGHSEVYIKSYSSGFLPMVVPLAPLLNVALFFIPFAGIVNERIALVREHLQKDEEGQRHLIGEFDACCGCCA
eukprot:TRINITY_DN16447_c0_g1_i1.p1 TRINITY_DN16447_c0_g1~~TRINITY_DN16447_c0_g1_i1.p1  ORF type:complete len:208 (+),score=42.04 TRINITY_DN16447_c0_g1_i1:186-809(+)